MNFLIPAFAGQLSHTDRRQMDGVIPKRLGQLLGRVDRLYRIQLASGGAGAQTVQRR